MTSTASHDLMMLNGVPSPVVLSSDDEEAGPGGAAGANRLDSVSPRPADSAHSSPAPSGGRVEAAVKSAGEQEESNGEFFEDVNMKITIPRRARMKDQVGVVTAGRCPPLVKDNIHGVGSNLRIIPLLLRRRWVDS